MPRRRYSELECFTLGLIWQLGPCSAYDVRRHMQRSPSTQWSASAGSIYPLLLRLQRRKLLSARDERTGKRRRRVYSITPAGLDVLRSWIGPPLAPEAITVAYDPLRSRVRFLAALTRKEQVAWLEAAQAALAQVAAMVREWHDTYGTSTDPFAPLLTRNGELEIHARTKWISEVQQAVNSHATSEPSGPSRRERRTVAGRRQGSR